jgi:hypothetical protein
VANRKGLRLVGWAYGAVTVMVALVAFAVVSAEINSPVEVATGADMTFAHLSK